MTRAPCPLPRPARDPRAGFSMVEIAFTTAVLTLVVGGVTSSFFTMQTAFNDQVAEAELQLKTRAAMDRLVRLTGTALSTDTDFQLVDSTTRTGTVTDFDSNYDLFTKTTTLDTSSTLQFREVTTVDADGKAVFDDQAKYFLLSPDSATPTDGIVIGRGPDADMVAQYAAGPDGKLGTEDDYKTAEFVDGTPAVEVVLPGDFSPQAGSMLEFTTEAGSDGRMVTITLRANVQRRDGSFLRDTDLVLQERVALRW